MAARRTNLTIPEGLYDLAQRTMALRHYESFSEYVAELIRRDALPQTDQLADTPLTAKVVSDLSTARPTKKKAS